MQAIDPRTLSTFHAAPIEGDVACVQCGYNLRGLARGGQCPECGGPIMASFGRGRFLFRNLIEAPIAYLKVLRVGFIVLAVCVVALATAIILTRTIGGIGPALLAAGISLVWWAGIILATTSEYPDGELKRMQDRLRWLRMANRTLQTVWAAAWSLVAIAEILLARQNAAIAAGLVAAQYDHWIDLASLGSTILLGIGLLTLVPLCVHFGEIATAAGNGSMATRLSLAAWGIVLFGGYLTLSVLMSGAGGIGSFLGFGISVAGIGLVAAMVLWIFSIGELAVMSCWAVTNAREARAREDRRLEREIREREAQHARLGSLPPLEMFHRPQARARDDAPIPLEPGP